MESIIGFSWDPIVEPVISYTLLFIAFVTLIFLELRRADRTFLFGRIFLNAVLILSLAGILLRPMLQYRASSSKVIIVTEDANRQVTDSLIQNVKNLTRVKYSDDVNVDLPAKDYSEVFVVGQGLSKADLSSLDNKVIHYFPSEIPGFRKISYDPISYVGFEQTIYFEHSEQESSTFFLSGPEGLIDSIQGNDLKVNQLSLKWIPRVEGRFVYQLSVIEDSLDRSTEVVRFGVTVKKSANPRILVYGAHPTYDLKYAKDVLREMDYPVASIIRVSKDKYSYERSNIDQKISLRSINQDLLTSFDLFLTTSGSLYQMSGSELSVIKEMVNDGLGLMLLADDPIKQSFPFDGVDLDQFSREDSKVRLANYPGEIEANKRGILRSTGLFPVHVSGQNEVISGYVVKNLGKASFINASNLYQFQLRGDLEGYRNILTDVINKTKRSHDHSNWYYFPTLAKTNKLIDFCYTGQKPDSVFQVLVKDSQGGSYTRYLKQDKFDETQFATSFNPKIAGWHTIEIMGDSTTSFNFFVDGQNGYTGIYKDQMSQDNSVAAFISANNEDQSVNSVLKRKSISSWIWFLVSIITLSLLWIESKL